MGVEFNVNSPADQTTLKLTPFDFTNQQRKYATFKLIARVRDIMNAIQGPKIVDINKTRANDLNIVTTRDKTLQWLPNTVLSANNPEYIGGFSSGTVNLTLKPNQHLFVRRDGENANATSAVESIQSTFDNQASQVTNNAPDSSLYAYPFVFSNYSLNNALRPLCVEPIIKWYWESYAASTQPPNVSVLKLKTLNSNIKNNVVFPGALSMFPSDAVAVNCSSLSTTTIGKLYRISPYIIDVSNTVEGLFPAVTSNQFDSDIALALDHTYISQDIEFALFLASLPMVCNNTTSGTHNILVDNYKYDPVEAIFSYLSTKKYEFTDNALYNISTDITFRRTVIISNKLALTYLIQQAAKMMKIWLSPAKVLADNIYSANELNNSLAFNTNLDFSVTASNVYIYFPIWIPYEYVKASNDSIEFDKPVWVSGKGQHMVAKAVRKPRSFINTNAVIVYYDKYGNGFSYYKGWSQTIPISIYIHDKAESAIRSSSLWSDDSLLTDYYLEQSDYFPAPDLEFNI